MGDKGGWFVGIHFFTGFPGFVATALIRELFTKGVTKEIYAVVLPSELEKAKAVVNLIEKTCEGCQIVLFEGDITLPNLDLANEELAVITPKIIVVWHLAGIHELSVRREQGWKVNVHGTANVNEFVSRLPNLQRYMYFSTTFIAGKRQGKILEMELIRPSAFHNYLEETKFEAELLVDDLKREIPITIVRPSIIYGHSETGATQKFDGIYSLMNFVEYFKTYFAIPQIGSKRALLHTVSIDYVTQVCMVLCENPEAEGETVHVTDVKSYPITFIYQELVKQMTGRKTFGTLPLGIAKVMLEQPSIRNTLHVVPQLIDYLDYEGDFDTKDCEKLVANYGLQQPNLIQILPALIQFYSENKHLQSYRAKIQ